MIQYPLVPGNDRFERIRVVFREADHVFVNLEGPLTDCESPADTIAYTRGAPSLAAEIKRIGVTVATVANNHAADFGMVGLEQTTDVLRKAGVAVVGAGRNLSNALSPTILQVRDKRIGFLGLACTLPNGCAAGETRAGIAPIRVLSRFVIDPVTIEQNPGMAPFVETVALSEDVEVATRAIREAKAKSDVLIVGIHWGVPEGWAGSFQSELATYQQPLARALVDAGADAILGHHPHSLHGIELYAGRPIFYSLGKFLSLLTAPMRPTRNYPPYEFEALHTNVGGGIARLIWQGNTSAPTEVELWFLKLEEGEPQLADPEYSSVEMKRLIHMSARFGTVVNAAEDRPCVAVIHHTDRPQG